MGMYRRNGKIIGGMGGTNRAVVIDNCFGCGGVRGMGEDVTSPSEPPPAVMGAALGIVPTIGLGLAIWAALNWDKWNRRSRA